MSEIARVGQLITFEYPSCNYAFARPRWERRLVQVEQVHEGPPPQSAIDADPLLNRRGALIVGRDFCRHGAVRSFYLGAARGLSEVQDVENLCDGASAPIDFNGESGKKTVATSEQGSFQTGSSPERQGGARKEGVMEGHVIEGCKALHVGIFVGDELQTLVDMEDPREAYCKYYNEIAAGGRHAHPVSLATSMASSSRLSE